MKGFKMTDTTGELSRDQGKTIYEDWPDILGAWRVCRKRNCQRNKRCRGGNGWRGCLRTNFRWLPEGVQAWFLILMTCREQGLSFDDAMAHLSGSDAEEGWIEWRHDIGQPVTEPKS